jgi:hypothetical protein
VIGGGAAGGQPRRGPFEVDTGRALDALRLEWGAAYAVCFDDAAGDRSRWQAWRLGKIGVRLEGGTPDELSAAMRGRRQAEVRSE